MGAIVRAFDTRAVVKEQIESMGAEFLTIDMKVIQLFINYDLKLLFAIIYTGCLAVKKLKYFENTRKSSNKSLV